MKKKQHKYHIGKITVEGAMSLAPLAGYTDAVFRNLISRIGKCGLMHSEMVSSEGLCRNRTKTEELIANCAGSIPFSVQLFGSNPDVLAQAARIAEDLGAAIVDINMGCPVKKVVRNGAGAALLRQPKLIEKIVSKVVSRTTTVPVTVKLRSGWSEEDCNNIISTALIIENAGASAITIHPRLRSQFFSGKANWSLIAELVENLEIPVIGNGDILTPEDGMEMFRTTKCEGIMIGRAALGNPWIFRQIAELREKGTYRDIGSDEKCQFIVEHLKELEDKYGSERACVLLRAFIGYYTKGMKNGKYLREVINSTKSSEVFIDEVQKFFNGY